jgi:hypothetical protein
MNLSRLNLSLILFLLVAQAYIFANRFVPPDGVPSGALLFFTGTVTTLVFAIALFCLEGRTPQRRREDDPAPAEYGPPEGGEVVSVDDVPVQLCPHCLAPSDPLRHDCPKCGEPAGRYAGYLPYENIRFQYSFLGRVWRRVWYESRGSRLERFGYFLVLVAIGPGMLIGLPFVLFTLHRRGDAATPADTSATG